MYILFEFGSVFIISRQTINYEFDFHEKSFNFQFMFYFFRQNSWNPLN